MTVGEWGKQMRKKEGLRRDQLGIDAELEHEQELCHGGSDGESAAMTRAPYMMRDRAQTECGPPTGPNFANIAI